jgi:hypothetical protein
MTIVPSHNAPTQVLPTKQSERKGNSIHPRKKLLTRKRPGTACITKEEFKALWGATMGNPSAEEDFVEHIDYPVKCFHASPSAAVGVITYAYHPSSWEEPAPIILLVYNAVTGDYAVEEWGTWDQRYEFCAHAERLADLMSMD